MPMHDKDYPLEFVLLRTSDPNFFRVREMVLSEEAIEYIIECHRAGMKKIPIFLRTTNLFVINSSVENFAELSNNRQINQYIYGPNCGEGPKME